MLLFVVKQKQAAELVTGDWSSDGCASDLGGRGGERKGGGGGWKVKQGERERCGEYQKKINRYCRYCLETIKQLGENTDWAKEEINPQRE